MSTSKKFTILLIKYLTQIISFIIFFYIFIAHILRLIKPVEIFIDQKVFNLSYLRFLFFLGLILGFIGWIIALVQKQTKIVSPFTQKKEENIAIALTAFFLAVFYNGVFSFAKILQYPIFVLLVLFFYWFIPQLVLFYSTFNLSDLKFLIVEIDAFRKKRVESGAHLYKKSIKIGEDIIYTGIKKLFLIFFILFSLLFTIFSFFFLTDIFSDYIKGQTYQENLNRKEFYINKVTPQKALHAQRVKIEGYNFGWKSETDSRYKLMSTDGPIKLIEEWTNERLEFTVPIDLSVGKKQIWIERPTDDPNRQSVIKSNSLTLDVLSRFVLYPKIDDTTFERVTKRVKRILFFDVKIFNNILFTKYE